MSFGTSLLYCRFCSALQSSMHLHTIYRANFRCRQLNARSISLSATKLSKKKEKIKDLLFRPYFVPVGEKKTATTEKVCIIGTGQVGIATASALLQKGICNNICLLDSNATKTEGEKMDLLHASVFLNNPKITATTDFADTACSRVCIITAGGRTKPGETRMQLLKRNIDIIRSIIPKVVQNNPETILMILTNPVDIITHEAWKLSGFPKNRVISTGCYLDSARFRYLVAQRLGIAPTSVHALIIGEHGVTSVPVWSSVSVGGTKLSDLNPNIGSAKDSEMWNRVHQDVVRAAPEVVIRKGYTSWGIGLTAATLTGNILNNDNIVASISVAAKGEECIEEDIFLSLPCVLGGNGVSSIVKMNLKDHERELLHKSAAAIAKAKAEVS